MGATASSRGWPIHFKNGEWLMDDTGKPDDGILPCKQCGKHPAEDEHDPCIANLPGVRNACCGHGDTEEPYISFVGLPRVTLRGQPAIVVMKALGGHPPCWDRPRGIGSLTAENAELRRGICRGADSCNGLSMRIQERDRALLKADALDDAVGAAMPHMTHHTDEWHDPDCTVCNLKDARIDYRIARKRVVKL